MTAPSRSSASSRDGAIVVTTSYEGLPLTLKVDDAALRRDPRVLAADILKLCKQSAQRAGLEHRRALEEAGFGPEIIAKFNLPTPDEVTREEIIAEYEDHEPSTWLRSL